MICYGSMEWYGNSKISESQILIKEGRVKIFRVKLVNVYFMKYFLFLNIGREMYNRCI